MTAVCAFLLPKTELPFAGHPTVGTAYLLSVIGDIPCPTAETRLIFEEGVGPVPVTIRAQPGQPLFSQLTAAQLPEYGPPPPPISALAEMLSLDPQAILDGEYQPQAVSCGVSFLFIPLRDREALAKAQLRRDKWQQTLQSYWTQAVYLFTNDTQWETSDVRSRMFAPAMGIEEDPATGAAATALAGYLGIRHPSTEGTLHWVVEQGFEMGRPSFLYVEADKQQGNLQTIRVGGTAVLVSQGTMTIPSPSTPKPD